MKKIEAIIRRSRFEKVKEALLAADIEWFSYYDVRGVGKMREAARTGDIGDGRIFIIPVEDAISIRTGVRGDTSLYNVDQETREQKTKANTK